MDEIQNQTLQKVKFGTLGCRLNQYETQAIREQFASAGFLETDTDKEADVYVLNTCTVTSESDRESRYLVRRFHKKNPSAKIVVTGCYVERNSEEIEKINGVTLTVLNRQKSEIVSLLGKRDVSRYTPTCSSFASIPSKRIYTPLSISEFEGRTRAYIKIQDGCNHACSFCKVVLVRGPARSRTFLDVIEEAKRLIDQGFQEVVLTGIQLGAYGYDLEKRQMLTDLIEVLSQEEGLQQIRLSSIEPTDVTDELIEAMTSFRKACPHLHIPLQSGDNGVLERMNRRYRREFFLDLIQKIRARVSNFVLTTDVMVGFPGETQEQFDQTVDVLLKTEPYKLHIFPYSAREGTRANRFQDEVMPQEKKRRRDILLSLECQLREKVQSKFLGKTLEVLIEENKSLSGWAFGRARNYLRIRFPHEGGSRSGFFEVQIEGIEETDLIGTLVSNQVLQMTK
ncbi:MAG: tRNA (N(6)-L-threonylcarbamoyladenosine(37)-C(2))-methylthiotransferase MtaB [Candidatus Omnitrophica bacterium]|nr:tRNA (N(6)-L-threonylcarbamoyladenosine(37)-C(2))-methylthiotransferase MtaB [Candidatus Omnitrophota bacterium]